MPRLLHGDLWTFNLLIRRDSAGATITGVLDIERAWWGDPLADWLMFLVAIRREAPEWLSRLSAFDEGYGISESSSAEQVRLEIYKAMHIGTSVVWSVRHGDMGDVPRARRDLDAISKRLQSLL